MAELRYVSTINRLNMVDMKRIPIPYLETMWADVIWDAIANKYPNIDKSFVLEIIHVKKPRTAEPWEKDVLRQIIVLQMIESDWRYKAVIRDLVIDLYCTACGVPRDIFRWRKETLELMEGYQTQIPPDAIESEMENVWKLLSESNTISTDDPLDRQLEIVAKVFVKLIYIHPFPDGNGRVARFLVNLLFRKWNLPYITIPKVRNNSEWLDAIQNAFNGDYDMVIAHFKKWLFEMIEKLEELNSEISMPQKGCETGEVDG